MISRGENIAFVSKILGHSSIKVTVDTYFKWIPKANRTAVEALDFTGQLLARNGNGAAMEDKQQKHGKRKLLKRKNEQSRNRTFNRLIKRVFQNTDFTAFNNLRAVLSGLFPSYPGACRQQIGNRTLSCRGDLLNTPTTA